MTAFTKLSIDVLRAVALQLQPNLLDLVAFSMICKATHHLCDETFWRTACHLAGYGIPNTLQFQGTSRPYRLLASAVTNDFAMHFAHAHAPVKEGDDSNAAFIARYMQQKKLVDWARSVAAPSTPATGNNQHSFYWDVRLKDVRGFTLRMAANSTPRRPYFE